MSETLRSRHKKNIQSAINRQSSRLSGWSFWLSSPLAGLLIPSLYIGGLFLADIVYLVWPLANQSSVSFLVGGVLLTASLLFVLLLFFRKTISADRQSMYDDNVPADISEGRWLALFQPFLILGILGIVAQSMDFVLSIRYGALDLVALRQVFADRQATPFAYPANLLAPFSSLTLGLTLLFYEKLSPQKKIAGIVVGLSLPVIGSIGLGGRAYIVDLMIWIPWWLMQRTIWSRPIIPRSSFVRIALPAFIIGSIVLLGQLSISRSALGGKQFESLFYYNRNSVLPVPEMVDSVYELTPVFANIVAESAVYWTSPIAGFDKIYHLWNLPPTWLGTISPLLYRRLVTLDISPSPEAVKNEEKEILQIYSIPSNGFITAPGMLIQTLGKPGTILAQVFLAVVGAYVFVRARASRNFILLYAAGLCFIIFFLWYQKFAMIYPIYEYGVLICIGAWLYNRISSSHSKAVRKDLAQNGSPRVKRNP